TLLSFYPNVKVLAAVPYLYQRDELRKKGVAKAMALAPEGTLSFGRSVLGELGIDTGDIESIVSSIRANDYASIRGVGNAIPGGVARDEGAGSGILGQLRNPTPAVVLCAHPLILTGLARSAWRGRLDQVLGE